MPVKRDRPHILLINPWIHDFAAYDYWAKPLGLLLLTAVLRQHDYAVSYIDCLDRFHPKANSGKTAQTTIQTTSARHGRGPYLKTAIDKPKGLEHIPRRFSRYGIKPEWLADDLSALATPDLVLMTSMMTYWYPGVRETIAVVRKRFPKIPIILGGIYATLCTDHARKTVGADQVIPGPSIATIIARVADIIGNTSNRGAYQDNPDTWPRPAHDLQHRLAYIPILTALGCPYQCTYCASKQLNSEYQRRSVQGVLDDILYWHHRHGVVDFVFYDDALLVDAKDHALPIFEGLVRTGMDIRLHTPNGIHIREIDDRLARWMFRAGMTTLRLGLETADFHTRKQMDQKVNQDEFFRGIEALKKAGFSRNQVGAYLLVGLPGQKTASIEASIRTVKQGGLSPVLAHYTPIPHTKMWDAACAVSPYDLAADPIFTNNAIFPCRPEGFSWESYGRLRELAAE